MKFDLYLFSRTIINGNSLEFFILDGVWHSLILLQIVFCPRKWQKSRIHIPPKTKKTIWRQAPNTPAHVTSSVRRHGSQCLVISLIWRANIFRLLKIGLGTGLGRIKLCHTPSKIKNSKEFPLFWTMCVAYFNTTATLYPKTKV